MRLGAPTGAKEGGAQKGAGACFLFFVGKEKEAKETAAVARQRTPLYKVPPSLAAPIGTDGPFHFVTGATFVRGGIGCADRDG